MEYTATATQTYLPPKNITFVIKIKAIYIPAPCMYVTI